MIPKKIHYCWFGGKPLNALGRRCLNSWKKYFPNYEIIEWNESNFDCNCCQYVREAYQEKKWAFVSDYVRFKVLYEQGGIYFDTDVEVVKQYDDIICKGAFMGCENPLTRPKIAVNPGLGIAVAPGLDIYMEILDDYENSSFYKKDGVVNLYTVVQRTTDILRKHGLQDTFGIQRVAGLTVYPTEYFCPIDMDTGELKMTENTHSIHRFAASWETPRSRMGGEVFFLIRRLLGEKAANTARNWFGK